MKKAVNKGCTDSLIVIGLMYYKGEGVEKNLNLALYYLNEAANQKNKYALYLLGKIYYEREGVEQDFTQALNYLKKSSAEGFVKSDIEIINLNITMDNNYILDCADYINLLYKDKPSDIYIKKLKSIVEKGANFIEVKSIKELKIDDLNKLSNDTIIFLKNSNIDINNNFYTIEDIKKIIYVSNEILKDIDLNGSKFDIFMEIYIKLAFLISYDFEAKYSTGSLKYERNTISRNLMVLINKKGVCAGYANVLKNILDLVGIECIYCSSILVKNNSCHAYNQVKIDDKWYYCDLTFDVNKIKNGNIKYCLKSKKDFVTKSSHTADKLTKEYPSNRSYAGINELFKKNLINLSKGNGISVLKSTGSMYYKGEVVEKDYTLAFDYYMKAANQGDLDAINRIGHMYYFGQGVEKNYSKAFDYFKKAAENGSKIALNTIGILYHNGEGAKQDFSKALEYFKKAADKGYSESQYMVGKYYQEGLTGEKNYQLAMNYYVKAADQGHIVSQFNVGFMYYNGIGVQKNNLEALKYLKVAAEKGNKEAETFINKIDNNMELEKKFISSASEGGKSK